MVRPMNEGVNAETMVNKAKKDMPNKSILRWLQRLCKNQYLSIQAERVPPNISRSSTEKEKATKL